MTTDTTTTTGGDAKTTTTTEGGDGKSSSMLDVTKITTAKDGAEGAEQPGTKTTTTEDPAAKGPADTTSQPGDKAVRPDYIPEKFWDAEKGAPRTEDIMKGYKELETKFRAGDHKAPEKPEGYKVELDDKSKGVLFGKNSEDPNKDPLYQKFTGWGVKNKISQAAMSEILGMYAEASVEETGKFQIDVGKERSALGKNADAIIQNQHSFFEQMFKAGEIGEAELKEASILFETAAGVKLVQAIRARYGEQSIPTNVAPVGDDVPSSEELGKMVVDPKYGVDKSFTAKVDGWYAKRYGNAPAMSSVVNR